MSVTSETSSTTSESSSPTGKYEEESNRNTKHQIEPESLTRKRKYVLISRTIIPFGQSTHTRNFGRSATNNQVMNYSNVRTPPYKISHRLCLVCNCIKSTSEIAILTDEIEKIFIVLSAIFRRQLEISKANSAYKQSPFFTCSSHFSETSSEILRMFGVGSAAAIFKARPRKREQVEKLVAYITRSSVRETRLLQYAYAFMLNHPEATAVIGPVIKEEDIPIDETVECKAIAKVDTIVPKCFRQPRKQRFDDEESGSSSMLRIIRREPLHLPTDEVYTPLVPLRKPLKCCYCLEVNEKELMLNVPKTRQRIVSWVKHLGERFGERLKENSLNFMCRKHFSSLDFSSRGRLLKDALPNFVPQEEVHTYKIYGNEFIRVPDDNFVHEREETSDIDIEN
ncbi:hypothetical protein GCK72_006073 [Caenorhabditis remanei]|uniref:THAP-type domain-containing protein n=1 Tax=Caenorhabditis remanei TaxID=31234 RepID=A0A6A5HHA4_CAERE|nr:hypothetical protein GCK72_006073 [Caenorhabditis remanei]KAF1766117.1 hypothetical protein GCK72_006073 [Caenorhabditis remanei]